MHPLHGISSNFSLNSHLTFFKDFSLENGEDCQYDSVLVESGFKDAKKKLCGESLSEASKVQISRLNTMVIHFQTDASHNSKGFRAVYETSKHSIPFSLNEAWLPGKLEKLAH